MDSIPDHISNFSTLDCKSITKKATLLRVIVIWIGHVSFCGYWPHNIFCKFCKAIKICFRGISYYQKLERTYLFSGLRVCLSFNFQRTNTESQKMDYRSHIAATLCAYMMPSPLIIGIEASIIGHSIQQLDT